MSKFIYNVRYFSPHGKTRKRAISTAVGVLNYIGTREGVELITRPSATATLNQSKRIEELLNAFPDSVELWEYEDYESAPTVENASALISAIVDNNIAQLAATEEFSSSSYLAYIGHRPGAEKNVQSANGLFTTGSDTVDMEAAKEELAAAKGNIYTTVLSLRREDAARLGFESASAWRSVIESKIPKIAKEYKIPVSELRWYAAFHNEAHHPHCHMILWTDSPKAFLTERGIKNIKSEFVRDIFRDELLSLYGAQQAAHRELKQQAAATLNNVAASPALSSSLAALHHSLGSYNGRMYYQYLPADIKSKVDNVVELLSLEPQIAEIYENYSEAKVSQLEHYKSRKGMPPVAALKDNAEFRDIKNLVLSAALSLESELAEIESFEVSTLPENDGRQVGDKLPSDDFGRQVGDKLTEPSEAAQTDRPTDDSKHQDSKNWWTDDYKLARKYLYGTTAEPPDLAKALRLLQDEALKENAFAFHDLGKIYMNGIGCEKDEDNAQVWFGKAYEAFREAEITANRKDYLQYRIGKLCRDGTGTAQDYEEAVTWFEKAVNGGNSFAAYSLGGLYRQGLGVEKNDRRAYELYRMAAENTKTPNAYAAYELGRMCKDGIGTDVDIEVSEKWYSQAYKQFEAISRSDIADDRLFYRLGKMNLDGIGTEINFYNAKKYFERAAELNNVDALYGLGKLYLNDNYAERDITKALEYFEEASEKGNAFAMTAIGKIYLYGSEADQLSANYELAKKYFERAAELEKSNSTYYLGVLYSRRDNIDYDAQLAASYFEESAAFGNAYANVGLAKLYLYGGDNFERNYEKAVELLTLAAEQGAQNTEKVLEDYNTRLRQQTQHAALSLVSSVSRLIEQATPKSASTIKAPSISRGTVKNKIQKGEKITHDTTIQSL